MRVAFFNGYEIWGGGEKWNFETIEKMLSLGHQVVFIGPSSGELYCRLSLKKEGHQKKLVLIDFKITEKTYFNLLKQISFLFILIKLNRELKINTFIYNSYRDVRAIGLAVALMPFSKKILRVGTPHAPKKKWSYHLTFKWGVNIFVGISNECINIFLKQVPAYLKNMQIEKITNGIDVNEFCPEENTKNEDETFVFGNCCRLTKQKRLDLFLYTIKALLDQGKNVRGIIAGDGELKNELIELRDKIGLREKVQFMGHLEETKKFYAKIDALLFTSEFEGTARTILEAMAFEKVVIAFRKSSMQEMLDDQKDGYLAQPFSLEDLTRLCLRILENKKEAKEMGKEGRKKVQLHYSNEAVYAKWVELISS